MKRFAKKIPLFFLVAMMLTLSVALCYSAEAAYEMVISSRSMNVGVKQSTQLSAEVKGVELQPQISWSSSDESIATVSGSGVVKGVKTGNFVVTAQASVGGETVSASYPMKVVENENIVNSYLETNHVLSYQYSYDYGGYYYANDKKSWQENFGFARVYDYVAPYVGMEYDYIRVFFTYDDEDFMVQLWKGQYGLFYGGEIGIYNRDADGLDTAPFTFYNAASERYWPTMDMSVYHQKKEGDIPADYELLFRRPVDKYWWCTGFVPGTLRDYEPADELRIEATVTFNDSAMASLFADGLRDCGFTRCVSKDDMGIDSYCQNGADVTVSWQSISEAENTMGVKAGLGVLLAARIIAWLFKYGWYGIALMIFF